MTFGEIIRKIRIQKGWTQKQLGEKCGIADSAIRRYELGGANPKIETIQKIADALDVPVSSLIAGRFDIQIETFVQDHPEGIVTTEGLYSGNYINLIKERLGSIGYPFMSDPEGNSWIKYPDGDTLDFSENELIIFMEEADSYLKFKLEELRRKKKEK